MGRAEPRHFLEEGVKDWAVKQIGYQRTGRRLPETLSPQEVATLFRATPSIKHRALLMTLNADGLRVSEVTHLMSAMRPGRHAARLTARRPRTTLPPQALTVRQ